jgi:biotin protein ligase-like protein
MQIKHLVSKLSIGMLVLIGTLVCTADTQSQTTILLFNGTGTTTGDVGAVEAVLKTLGLKYATSDSVQMNAMTETQLKAYTLLIVPGGNSITIGNHLTKATTDMIRMTVQNDGLHYLGLCAGAFFGGFGYPENNLNLTNGVWFNFYSAYDQGIYIASENLSLPNGTKLDVYWQVGPQLSGWGSVVAKFPDGTPAIVEGKSGNGWVILTGVHPEAPASWRTCCTFTTPLATDLAYAGTLIKAALHATTLPHF